MAYDVAKPSGGWQENLPLDVALRTAGARHLMSSEPVRIRNRETGRVVTYNRRIKPNQTREQAKADIDAYARRLARELTGKQSGGRVSGRATVGNYANSGRAG